MSRMMNFGIQCLKNPTQFRIGWNIRNLFETSKWFGTNRNLDRNGTKGSVH